MGDPLLITTTMATVVEPEVSMMEPEVFMLEPDGNSSHSAQVPVTV